MGENSYGLKEVLKNIRATKIYECIHYTANGEEYWKGGDNILYFSGNVW